MIKNLGLTLLFSVGLSFITPTQKQEDKIITIKLPVSKVNIVMKGLSKLPLEESQETYLLVLQQAQIQLADTTKSKK